MPSYSANSLSKLRTCDDRIQKVFMIVISLIDNKIIFGSRTTNEQKMLFTQGRTKLDGVTKKSEHQADPPEKSRAIDVAPYPVKWPDETGIGADERAHRVKRFHVLAGLVIGIAYQMDIDLRWGGDWDGDWTYNDQKFHDLGHFELMD